MQTEHNERGERAAHDEANESAAHDGDVDEGLGDEREDARDHGSDRADHEIGRRSHDGKAEEGHSHGANELRNGLVEHALELRGSPNGDEDGDNARGVTRSRKNDRDTQEGVVEAHLEGSALKDGARDLGRRGKVDHRGIDERRAERHAEELVAAELLGRGVAQDNGQEVEEPVRDGVPDHIGTAIGGEPAHGDAKSEQALDHTGGGKGHKRGSHAARDRIHQHVKDVMALLALVLGRIVLSDRAHARDLVLAHELLVDIVHGSADNDLVLAAGLHDLDDAVKVADRLVLSDLLVFERKTQSRDAVAHVLDIFDTADPFEDLAGEFMVLTHVLTLSVDKRTFENRGRELGALHAR